MAQERIVSDTCSWLCAKSFERVKFPLTCTSLLIHTFVCTCATNNSSLPMPIQKNILVSAASLFLFIMLLILYHRQARRDWRKYRTYQRDRDRYQSEHESLEAKEVAQQSERVCGCWYVLFFYYFDYTSHSFVAPAYVYYAFGACVRVRALQNSFSLSGACTCTLFL